MLGAPAAAVVVALALALAGGVAAAARDRRSVFDPMLAAEDRRVTTRAAAAPLLAGLDATAPGIQYFALLGLGRLENPAFLPDIARLLDSPVPEVRAQAANAIGQAVTSGMAPAIPAPVVPAAPASAVPASAVPTPAVPTPAAPRGEPRGAARSRGPAAAGAAASAAAAATPFELLRARAQVETDPSVRGMLARTMGRLPFRSETEVRAAEQAIVALSWRNPAAAGAPNAAGAANDAGDAANSASTARGSDAAQAGGAASADGANVPGGSGSPNAGVTAGVTAGATATAPGLARALGTPDDSGLANIGGPARGGAGAARVAGLTLDRAGAPNGLRAEGRAESEVETLVGVAHGLASLARKSARVAALSDGALERLRELARSGLTADGAEAPVQADGATLSLSEPRPSEPRPGEPRPSEPRPDEPRPGEVRRPGEARPSAPQSTEGQRREPASSRLGEAARRQSAAEFRERAREMEGLGLPRLAADRGNGSARMVRRLALSALASAKDADASLLEAAASDPDDQARRLSLLAALANGASPLALQLSERLRRDPAFIVRYEALRTRTRLRSAASTPGPASAAAPSNAALTAAAAPSAPASSNAATAPSSATPATTATSPAAAVPPSSSAASPSAPPSSNGATAPNATAASSATPRSDEVTPSGAAPPSAAGSSPAGASLASAVSSCEPELEALADSNMHIVLLAIDELADCASQPTAANRLTAIVDERGEPGAWHRPAHAIVSLAGTAPDRARVRLARFGRDEVWEVRAYAAKAAGVLKDRATLEGLAQDPHDNVRHAAIEALQPLAGHEADGIYLAQLARDDYQLVRTAARALAGTPQRTQATSALLSALARITAEKRDTSRDPRLALLDALEKAIVPAPGVAEGTTPPAPGPASASRAVAAAAPAAPTAIDLAQPATAPPPTAPTGGASTGAAPSAPGSTASASQARAASAATEPVTTTTSANASRAAASFDVASAQLEPYLSDFDPVIARRVAALLSLWTGRPRAARPRPLPRVPTPSRAELERLRPATAIVHMASGREFTITLAPLEAPTNVARFVRQVRAGEFNGLTFHRVEPTFVIQGGSPRANEYAGAARFTRDEVSPTSHVRGTVGISTRGRDTGDGQIFINLVDNVRLDHTYTIIGAVTDGMDAVDDVLEGDVITRIDLQAPALVSALQ